MDRRPRQQMVFWNANEQKNKKIELTDFVHLHDLDAILINEIHLLAADGLNLPKYRDGRGGGTAIFVKTGIEHFDRQTPPMLGHPEATLSFPTSTNSYNSTEEHLRSKTDGTNILL